MMKKLAEKKSERLTYGSLCLISDGLSYFSLQHPLLPPAHSVFLENFQEELQEPSLRFLELNKQRFKKTLVQHYTDNATRCSCIHVMLTLSKLS